MNTPMANAMSAAELTLCQMLNLTKSSISLHNGIIKNQSWKHHYSFFGELNRKLLGIIGYGHVGQRVSQLAKAFGMDIQVYDPYIDDAIIRQHNVFRVGLIELLRTSDFTSLHVPLTSETKKMINYQTLEHFNPDGYLLNMSRGEVIDENALIEALQKKKIKGAALDVFMKEPLTKDSRFLKIPNVLLTPHVGGYTRESYIRASQDAVDKILEFFGAGKVTDYLPPNVEWSKFLINSP